MTEPYILCVTLNPCLDKTLTVPAWKPGDNVRGTAVREVVGGKGNNVARALKGLGLKARPCTFFGGATGHRCAELLKRDDGLEPLAIASDAETRTILTVRTGETAIQSAFFDPDPAISAAEAENMFQAIQNEIKSGQVRALTLSGSSPSKATQGLYGELIRLARSNAIPVFLDTYGAALKNLGDAVPDVIQLNRKEVSGILGLNQDSITQKEILAWLKCQVDRGSNFAIVTQGPDNILAATPEGFLVASPPVIEPVNPIGSGDCFLAGLTFASLQDATPEMQLKTAAAAAVANAMTWDAGAINTESLTHWLDQVQLRQLIETT